MFVRNLWYVAAWSSELTDRPLGRTIIGDHIVMFRDRAGRAVAIGDLCPHRFAPLSMGKICDDGTLECPYHGLRFDGSGACVVNPHDDGHIPRNARVSSYPLCERYGILWAWMGDQARADESRIPVFDQIDSPNYRTITGHMKIDANYELIADNLLDQSHAQFVHPRFFRADVLTTPQEVIQDGQTVISRRWIPNIKAPYVYSRLLDDQDQKVDHWMGVRWNAPGLHRLDVGVTQCGRSKEEGLRREGSHLLTPETEKSTHYFFASSRNYKLIDDEEDNAIMEWQRIGFGQEDKPMIEAVQRVMGDRDLMSMKPVMISIDTAAVRARRVMDALRNDERADLASKAG